MENERIALGRVTINVTSYTPFRNYTDLALFLRSNSVAFRVTSAINCMMKDVLEALVLWGYTIVVLSWKGDSLVTRQLLADARNYDNAKLTNIMLEVGQ